MLSTKYKNHLIITCNQNKVVSFHKGKISPKSTAEITNNKEWKNNMRLLT